jgi:predicted amidophosphoribosyltransferase
MLCESCARETKSAICAGCGGTVAVLGPFCYLCGHRLDDADLPAASPDACA